ncbi:MAG: ribonuclease E/G, partial [Pseudomonadota bacterium]
MTLPSFVKLVQYEAPGQTCAVFLDQKDRPCRIFIERWNGAEVYARYGSVQRARLRRFADEIQGAFLELESGEEAFLRLKSRDALTEGAALCVKVMSERRRDKLARVSITAPVDDPVDSFSRWQTQLMGTPSCPVEHDRACVEAAIDEACSRRVTLPSGGHLHIERTRALTAVDIDTAGRRQKGSAGAKALSINREAAIELARQIALRGLGGI